MDRGESDLLDLGLLGVLVVFLYVLHLHAHRRHEVRFTLEHRVDERVVLRRDVAPGGPAVAATLGRLILLRERAIFADPCMRDRVGDDDVVAGILGLLDLLDVGERREAVELGDVEVKLIGIERCRAAL